MPRRTTSRFNWTAIADDQNTEQIFSENAQKVKGRNSMGEMGHVVTGTRIASAPAAGTFTNIQGKIRLLLKSLLSVKSYDRKTDVGLLILRVFASLILFIKHGWEKIAPGPGYSGHPTFSHLMKVQADPFHIGHAASELIAMTSDAICSALLIVGLGTRLAASFIVATSWVAWSMVKHFVFLDPATRPAGQIGKDTEAKSGEILALYIVVNLAIALMGPGKYSLDWRLWKKKGE
jgi:putative oxidoreductase